MVAETQSALVWKLDPHLKDQFSLTTRFLVLFSCNLLKLPSNRT
ncbi:hypothetical protein SLEP1_g18076 [Rubroshorea leprosula]|uniref:Uncharacterized protein n=1 Tax=Rubroshorea leprosula TaxID=152421 RepID=A0AAV5IWC7_9ROSI|nr:hypothetical protein SLEP1_g18076 [Rubroshorea leprosula]